MWMTELSKHWVDLLQIKIFGTILACRRATSWSFVHRGHMAVPMSIIDAPETCRCQNSTITRWIYSESCSLELFCMWMCNVMVICPSGALRALGILLTGWGHPVISFFLYSVFNSFFPNWLSNYLNLTHCLRQSIAKTNKKSSCLICPGISGKIVTYIINWLNMSSMEIADVISYVALQMHFAEYIMNLSTLYYNYKCILQNITVFGRGVDVRLDVWRNNSRFV